MSFISGLKQKWSSHKGLKKAKKCIQCGKYKTLDQFPGTGDVCFACVTKLDDFNENDTD
jgi:hypothetical protein